MTPDFWAIRILPISMGCQATDIPAKIFSYFIYITRATSCSVGNLKQGASNFIPILAQSSYLKRFLYLGE
jgi:hypothetical protein